MSVGIISGSVLALQKKKKQEEPSPTPTETDMRVGQSKAYENANKRLAGETYAPPQYNFSGQSWSGYGYPQYEKKYDVPELPKGAVITKIAETPEKSLNIEYSLPRNLSVSEQLMKYEFNPIAQRLGLPSTKPLEMFTRPQDVRSHPLAVIGGIVAPFETTGYVVARAFGVSTPDLPPNFLDPNVARQYPEYTFGGLMGEVAILVGGSYVINKAISGASAVAGMIGSKIEEETGIAQKLRTSKIGEFFYGAKEKVPSLQGFKEPFINAEIKLAERSKTIRDYLGKGLATEYSDVADIGYTAPRTMSEKVLGLPELESPYVLKGLQPIEAEATAWNMGSYPHSAILDPDVSSIMDNPLTKHLYGLRSLPYLPEATSISRPSLIPRILTAGAILGSQFLPNEKTSQKRSLDIAPLSRTSIGQPTRQDFKQNEDVASIVESVAGIDSSQSQKVMSSLMGKTAQATGQVQVSKTVMGRPSPTRTVFNIPRGFDSLSLPSSQGGRRKKGKGVFPYYQFERQYPIATSPEMAYAMLGIHPKGMRRKRK